MNALNQYTQTAGTLGTSYAYDRNGNLVWDGSSNFAYDGENRLVAASGAKSATLSYDPLGRLWQVSGAAGGTTRFLYDGDRLAMELDGSGTVTRAYVHGPGADEPMVTYGPEGRRFLHADHQGSIIAANDDSGNAVYVDSYDPWGVPAATNQGRFGYTGQTWLPELGMYYYKARIYWPTIGRFMQTDPIGYDDQVNLYGYVGNDPVNEEDPSGECTGTILCDGRTGMTMMGGFVFGRGGCVGGCPSTSNAFAGANGSTSQPSRAPTSRGQGNPTASPGQLQNENGSQIPFKGVRLSRDRILVDAAEQAADSIPPFFNSLLGRSAFGWLRGILIHNRFAANIRAMNNPMYNAEVSYLRGRVVPYGTPGASRVDAVVGNPASPLFAIDLKTGAAVLGAGQLNAYRANIPPSALIQQILIP